jgi:GPH family glycoside/pentoside/hexuronide:cation symporter
MTSKEKTVLKAGSSFVQKLSYGLGYFPFLYANLAVAGHVQFVYTDIFKLDATQVGLVWSLYSLFNAIIEPVMGVLSDNSPFQIWGSKRVPWVLLSFIPWTLSFWFLWSPSGDLFTFFLLCIICFGLFNAMISINYSALFNELFLSDEEKSATSDYKVLFSILGLMGGIVLPPIITNAWTDFTMLKISGAILLTMGILTYYSASSEKVESVKFDGPPAGCFIENAKVAFKSSSFRSFLVFFFFISLGNAVMVSFLPMCMKYLSKIHDPVTLFGVELSAVNQNGIALASFYICGILATKLWNTMSTRYGVVPVLQLELFLYGSVLMSILIIPTGFVPLWIAMVFLGLTMSGFMIFPDLLMSYVIDEDEILHKQGKRVGLFVGIRQITVHGANALQGVLVGWMLKYGQYVPGIPEQGDLTILILRIGYAIPALCFILCSVLLLSFPLSSEKLNEMRKKTE